jgi:hypothetical protein
MRYETFHERMLPYRAFLRHVINHVLLAMAPVAHRMLHRRHIDSEE